MVVGGYGMGRVNTTELVSLDPLKHPVPECLKILEPYPYEVSSANGGMLGGTDGSMSPLTCLSYYLFKDIIIVCGGRTSGVAGSAYPRDCHKYDPLKNKW